MPSSLDKTLIMCHARSFGRNYFPANIRIFDKEVTPWGETPLPRLTERATA